LALDFFTRSRLSPSPQPNNQRAQESPLTLLSQLFQPLFPAIFPLPFEAKERTKVATIFSFSHTSRPPFFTRKQKRELPFPPSHTPDGSRPSRETQLPANKSQPVALNLEKRTP